MHAHRSPQVDGVQHQHMKTLDPTTPGSIVKKVTGTQNQLHLHIQEVAALEAVLEQAQLLQEKIVFL